MKKHLAIILASQILLSTASLKAQSEKDLKATQAWLKKLKGKEYTLAEHKSLKKLHLAGEPVSDSGLVHLKELKSLNYLNLSDSKVTDAGGQKLKKALPKCEIVASK